MSWDHQQTGQHDDKERIEREVDRRLKEELRGFSIRQPASDHPKPPGGGDWQEAV